MHIFDPLKRSRDAVKSRSRRRAGAVCLATIAAQAIAAGGAFAQNETQSNPSWGLDRIDQRDLPLDLSYSWPQSPPPGGGAGVNLIVLGTGLNILHQDFTGRATVLYDAADGNAGIDCNGLGTLMGSLAGGIVSGAAKRPSVRSVGIADCAGDMQISDVIDGLDYVAAWAATIGGPNVALLPAIWCDPEVNAAIQNLIDAGVTVVVPAGDDGHDLCRPDCTPLAVPDAIVVGAVDQNDCRAPFSNFGPGVDIFAPGLNAVGASFSDDFSTTSSSGTALAASYVAGIVTNYLSVDPLLAPTQVQDLLLSRSTPIAGCSGEGTLRLAYSGLDDHPVPPPPGPGENPCPEECPPCINFEELPDGTPTVDQTFISDEYAACGVTYEIVDPNNGNQSFPTPKYPAIAQAGNPTTAFAGGCNNPDTVFDDHLADIDLGQRFLTDDLTVGAPAGNLLIAYSPPTRRTGGWIIDTDRRSDGTYEEWTVSARRQDGSEIDTYTITAPPYGADDPDGCNNSNGPGDRMPELWYFDTTEDIHSVLVAYTGTTSTGVGVAFDHFCPYDIPFDSACVEVETGEVLCAVDPENGPTGDYDVTLTVTNNSGIDARYILLPDSITEPDFIALPAALPGDGSSTAVRITLTGVAPLEEACFMMVLADANVDECCAGEEVCVTVPECDCLQATNAQLDCDPLTGVVTLEFDMTNLTMDDVEHVYVLPPLAPAVGFEIEIPDSYFDIPTLMPYQTAHIGPVVLENATADLDVDLRVTMHVETFEECCSEVLPITTPMCASAATLPDNDPCVGDLDDDGQVGFGDMTALLAAWDSAAVDLNGDGIATFADLTKLLSFWGPCAN